MSKIMVSVSEKNVLKMWSERERGSFKSIYGGSKANALERGVTGSGTINDC